MNKIINIENLEYSYAERFALKNISLSVGKGQFISIIGPNGSGKTTLFKNLSGILKGRGVIEIKGKNIEKYSVKELARIVAVVHQNRSSGFQFTVEETISMGRYPYLKRFSWESKEDERIVEEAMIETEVMDLRDRLIDNLSGGERQRVMIARALAQEPEILLLDEPVNHLDIHFQLSVLGLCKRLNLKKEMTVITILHDINLACRYSDRIVLLKDGEVFAKGSVKEIITKENISEVYNVDVNINTMEGSETPYVIPKHVQIFS